MGLDQLIPAGGREFLLFNVPDGAGAASNTWLTNVTLSADAAEVVLRLDLTNAPGLSATTGGSNVAAYELTTAGR
jgi:hypothetical protein